MERGGRTPVALVVALGLALYGFLPSAWGAALSDLSQPIHFQSLTSREQNLLHAVNAARSANGAPPLRVDPRLQRAARAHSRAMLRSGQLDHGNWFRRLRRFGVRGRMLGETIAWGAGAHGTPTAIVAMWLQSPPHRSTLLTRGFRRVGVGLAAGTFQGFPGANVATADFAGS